MISLSLANIEYKIKLRYSYIIRSCDIAREKNYDIIKLYIEIKNR